MAVWLCACGRHVRWDDAQCPFCGTDAPAGRRKPGLRRRVPRATLLMMGSAALGVACAARTGLDVATGSSDGSTDAPHDAASKDGAPDSPFQGFDGGFDAPLDAIHDVVAEDHGMPPPPYGGVPPPPDEE